MNQILNEYEDLISNEFQINFFENMKRYDFWIDKKDGVIKDTINEVILSYYQLLKNRESVLRSLSTTYGVQYPT